MWQNILVFMIVGLTAGLVAWQFHRKLTGRASCCGGCASKGSCASVSLRQLDGPGRAAASRADGSAGCGCVQHSGTGAATPPAGRRP